MDAKNSVTVIFYKKNSYFVVCYYEYNREIQNGVAWQGVEAVREKRVPVFFFRDPFVNFCNRDVDTARTQMAVHFCNKNAEHLQFINSTTLPQTKQLLSQW